MGLAAILAMLFTADGAEPTFSCRSWVEGPAGRVTISATVTGPRRTWSMLWTPDFQMRPGSIRPDESRMRYPTQFSYTLPEGLLERAKMSRAIFALAINTGHRCKAEVRTAGMPGQTRTLKADCYEATNLTAPEHFSSFIVRKCSDKPGDCIVPMQRADDRFLRGFERLGRATVVFRADGKIVDQYAVDISEIDIRNRQAREAKARVEQILETPASLPSKTDPTRSLPGNSSCRISEGPSWSLSRR